MVKSVCREEVEGSEGDWRVTVEMGRGIYGNGLNETCLIPFGNTVREGISSSVEIMALCGNQSLWMKLYRTVYLVV